MKPNLGDMLRKAMEQFAAMSPAEKQAMLERQRRSFARAEAGFGSDADEAEYRAAIRANDLDTLARLDVEAAQRIASMEKRDE